jgi:16S rRNA (adenine1518-N6/adenine1519-N6)-dimethyltransferase
VQKEVAERLYAKSGTKAFGALSVRVQYLAECELICSVPAPAFYPPPKVDSAVVRLRPRLTAPPAADPKRLETLVKLGFAAKRKMLRNNLKSVVESDRLTQLLEQLNINPQARAEDLGVSEWVELSHSLPPI